MKQKPDYSIGSTPLRFKRKLKVREKKAFERSASKAQIKTSSASSDTLHPQNILLQLGLLRPSGQSEEERFKWDYLFTEAMSKWPLGEDANSPEVRESLAIEKLLASNARCKEINDNGYESHDLLPAVMLLAQREISDILHRGTNNPIELFYEAFASCSIPAGATTSHPYKHRALCVKYTPTDDGGRNWTCTPRAFKYFKAQQAVMPWLSNFTISFHPGNEIFTVDKNSVIDRGACKESIVNAELQARAGGVLRKCLRAVGVDLNSQSRNQQLAFLGSVTGAIATVDLSSASDLNSSRLVWDLLPSWLYDLLDDLRSHYALLPGTNDACIKWDLFSTMGNGFTFELESLLFYALAKACAKVMNAKGPVTVYGDDIICPVDSAPLLLEILSCVGHKPNEKKTFFTGPFRESCGKHYYNGVDVTPFYFRKEINTVQRINWFLNRLRVWAADKETYDLVCSDVVYPLWQYYNRRFALTGNAFEGDIDSVEYVYKPFQMAGTYLSVRYEVIRYRGYGPLYKFFNFCLEEPVKPKYGTHEEILGNNELGQDTDSPYFVSGAIQHNYGLTTPLHHYYFPSEILHLDQPLDNSLV